MILQSFLYAPSQNLSYLLYDPSCQEGIIIDPSYHPEVLVTAVREHSVNLRYVLNTHSHPDHTAGNAVLLSATGAQLRPEKGSLLEDGAELRVGSLSVKVIATPGHTPDSVCFLVEGKLFTGDTLFVGECGRTDLPGGDASLLYDSLFGKLLLLPEETEVYPGHDYGPRPDSTLAEERRSNYVLEPRTREDFVRFLAEP